MLSNRAGGIYVRVKTDNSSQTLVTLSGYKSGQAPILLVDLKKVYLLNHSLIKRASSLTFLEHFNVKMATEMKLKF